MSSKLDLFKMIRILIVFAILIIGCAKKTNLNPEISLLNQAHAVYKIDEGKITDFLIEMVNIDILTKPKGLYIGEILLSLAPVGRESHFDCDRFYNAIGVSRKNVVQEKMKPYLFKCKDGAFKEDAALEKFSDALNPTIVEPFEVDATWAWFSATGNHKALERIITNYLHNDKACLPCIEWSYSTNYRQNVDVSKYLRNYSQSADNKDKLKLIRLAPK